VVQVNFLKMAGMPYRRLFENFNDELGLRKSIK